MFATVDAEDHEALSRRKWHILRRNKPHGTDYAVGWPNPRGEAIHQDRMHRVIMGAKDGEDVRFRDGNGLNCSRDNLQIVTHAELRRTSKISETHNTSGAKGVSFNNRGQRKWRAYICVNRKHIGLGHHATFDEAVAARKAGEEKYFGEFANQHAPGECNPSLPAVLNVTWFPPADPLNLETPCANCHALETQQKRDSIFKNTDESIWIGRKRLKANLHPAA